MTQSAIPFLDLGAQHRGLKAEIMKTFEEALDTTGFIGGPEVEAFEKEFAAFSGAPYAVSVANGTEALRLALVAMKVKPGSLIITVPNSFIATTEAISQAGAVIGFVDIDPATSLMDPNRLEDFLKKNATDKSAPKASAVIPVHLYGQCADMDAILSLAAKYELMVLEDAAQAHGAAYKGKPAGTMGMAAGFSFYPGKNLGACGEAGAVITKDEKIAHTIRMMRDHGQKTKYYHDIEGCNGRMDAIQARILRIKLRHLAAWNEERRKIAQYYDTQLAGLDWVRPTKVLPHNRSCHHLYVIHVAKRDALQEHLKNNGVMTGQHYPVPLHLQQCYRHMNLAEGSFPHSERAALELLSLPMFAELGLERAQKVVDAIRSFK